MHISATASAVRVDARSAHDANKSSATHVSVSRSYLHLSTLALLSASRVNRSDRHGVDIHAIARVIAIRANALASASHSVVHARIHHRAAAIERGHVTICHHIRQGIAAAQHEAAALRGTIGVCGISSLHHYSTTVAVLVKRPACKHEDVSAMSNRPIAHRHANVASTTRHGVTSDSQNVARITGMGVACAH